MPTLRSRLKLPCVVIVLPVFAVASMTTYARGGDERSAFFEKRVRPILSQRCSSCHSDAGKKLKGGLSLDRRSALLKGGDSGPAIVPGDPEGSLLIHAIQQTGDAPKMPPSGQLSQRERDDLVAWVRQGATMPETKKAGAPSIGEGKKHWAFQPLRESPTPKTKLVGWSRRWIDGWILAGLEDAGLTPTKPASPRTLLRRLKFDLVGLPPTPEELAEFDADPSDGAYEKFVERYLTSPHHGERWARHWLDLSRYCDVPEPWFESKGKPYLYRDWVTNALNADVPFRRFVQLQIAADQLPGARPADLAALGFLGLSPSYWKELKLDKDVIRTVVAEEWEERIEAISGVFLGLSMACARCHDHKHDPIKSTDYYALAGVLASTQFADRSLLPPARAAQVTKAKAELDALEAKIEKLKKGAKKDDAGKKADAKEMAELTARATKIRTETPDIDQPLACAIEDSALFVLADGPNRTRLETKRGQSQDVRVQKRGNPADEGELVPRRFLQVLSPAEPKLFRKGSGRLDLADAITQEAAPLLARVIVNRVWKHHFGTGLVETPSDFGTHGDAPSHPELLDGLANRFAAKGWSLRWLHREIVLSATYRQASDDSEAGRRIDPDNRKLWHMSRRRLDAESWRDAMLATAGTLDLTVGGPPVNLDDPKNVRRTLYGVIKRRELSDYLRLHDVPDPTNTSAFRVATITPLQQLFTLNSGFMKTQAQAFANRLAQEAGPDPEARIRRAFLLATGRHAKDADIAIALAFLRDTPTARINDARWAQFAQAMLASNEFQFVD